MEMGLHKFVRCRSEAEEKGRLLGLNIFEKRSFQCSAGLLLCIQQHSQ